MFIIISYDISEDKRRNKIFKILKDYGQWIQYSLFECDLAKKDYLKLRDRLERVIDDENDSIRFYFVCNSCRDKIEKIGGPSDQNGDIIII